MRRAVRIAARLRHETTITLEWIAARLFMDAPSHVASLLQHQEARHPPPGVSSLPPSSSRPGNGAACCSSNYLVKYSYNPPGKA